MTPETAYTYLHEHKCSVTEVAAYAGISTGDVIRLSARWAQESVARAQRRFSRQMAGRHGVMTWRDVSERIGCSRATAYRILARIRG